MKTVNRFADVLNKNLALLSVLCALFALMVPSFWTNLAGSVNLDLSWVPFMGRYFSSLGSAVPGTCWWVSAASTCAWPALAGWWPSS